MTFSHEDWNELLTDSFKTISALSKLKGGEYAHGNDRLDNFRRNATALGLPMEAIWHTYAAKHWDAITTAIRDQVTGTTRERLEPITGRVDDLIVYLLLYKAMLIERTRT